MKVIIAGSRNIENYQLVENIINDVRVTLLRDITEIVCGMARGVDLLGLDYATNHNIPVKKFPAEWNKYGKSAGYRRNEKMADYADYLIAIWDGKSKGTKHMIDIANKKDLSHVVKMV